MDRELAPGRTLVRSGPPAATIGPASSPSLEVVPAPDDHRRVLAVLAYLRK
jgi:hypothetical protein